MHTQATRRVCYMDGANQIAQLLQGKPHFHIPSAARPCLELDHVLTIIIINSWINLQRMNSSSVFYTKSCCIVWHALVDVDVWNTVQEKYGVDEVHYVNEMCTVLRARNASTLLVLDGENTDSGRSVTQPTFAGIESFKVFDISKVGLSERSQESCREHCPPWKSFPVFFLEERCSDVSTQCAHFSPFPLCVLGRL